MPGMARWHTLDPPAAPEGRLWHAALPPGAAGRWCRVRLRGVGAPARLVLHDERRGHAVRELWAARGATLLHVPQEARALGVLPFGPMGARPRVLVRPLSRAGAAMRLLLAGAWRLPAALPGPTLGLSGRARAVLGRAGRAAAPSYDAWIARFDRWDDSDRARLLASAGSPPRVVVCAGPAEATRATLESLDRQWRRPGEAPAPHVVIPAPPLMASAAETPGTLPPALLEAARAAPDGHVLLLEAGEVLPPHALAALVRHAGLAPPRPAPGRRLRRPRPARRPRPRAPGVPAGRRPAAAALGGAGAAAPACCAPPPCWRCRTRRPPRRGRCARR